MSAPLGQHDPIDSESEMMPQDPPPRIIRGIAWLLVAMFGTAMIAAITVHLPETVSAPFILAPKNGADPIQSSRLAVVSRVNVSEGETVKAGQELFVLRSDEIRGLSTQAGTLAEDLRTHEHGLVKADTAYASQLEIKLAEISNAESEVKFREKHTATSRELVDRMETLSNSGGISKVEFIRLRLDLAASEKDLSVAQRTLQQVTLDRQRMESEHAQLRGEQVAEIEKLKFRIAALKSDLENSQQNMLSVRAPYDGVVISLTQRNAGSVVQNGQELCQLARLDAQPHARLLLGEAGLPKLAVGQRVRFFFDAFPYQRYGAVNAKLDWISPSAVSSPEGTHFVALASLDESEKSHGKSLPIRVGMRGEARIVVGRRTLIEYAFEPIRQLRENIRD
jgi:multidrug efflux pump subunit AcrA (membrane-fusion protein)